jgi:Tfp pilus assembly protein PilF
VLTAAGERVISFVAGLRKIVKTAGPLTMLLALLLVAAPAFAQSPPQAEARFSAGVMHLRAGRVDLALGEFKRAVDEDPKNPYFRKGLGQAYAASREWDHAIEEFRKALELNPYYIDVRNDLGTALILAGKREEGKQEFVSAYGDPTNPTPETSAYNLGQAYLDEKNCAEAVNWFRTSLARNAKYARAHLGLAEALVQGGRLPEAIVQLEQSVAAVPDDAALVLALGQVYFKDGRFKDARARLEEAMKMDPGGAAGRTAAQQIQALPH